MLAGWNCRGLEKNVVRASQALLWSGLLCSLKAMAKLDLCIVLENTITKVETHSHQDRKNGFTIINSHTLEFLKRLLQKYFLGVCQFVCLSWSLSLLPRLESSSRISAHCNLTSWDQVILLPQPPEQLVLQVCATTPGYFLYFSRDRVSLCQWGWSQTPDLK